MTSPAARIHDDTIPHTARERREERIDAALTILLAVQCLTLFAVLPLGPIFPDAHMLMDICHLAFAAVCVTVLTRHRPTQIMLLAALMLLAAGPIGGDHFALSLGLTAVTVHDVIALVAFAFNGLMTFLIGRHVFGADRVTASRIQGAVLLYLNIASLFAIAYSALEAHVPGAIITTLPGPRPSGRGIQSAAMTYFSLSTITTAGYGDFVPVHPIARSLANLEAVLGQLYPATMIARLVALHLAHSNDDRR
jgi:hypothetical protein